MKRVRFSNAKKYFIIDDEDLERVKKRGVWQLSSHGYVRRTEGYLHKFLMNPGKGLTVDHIDGNKMNNRKENLRICTQAENMRNVKVGRYKNKSCKRFKGVCKLKIKKPFDRIYPKGKKWRAYIVQDDKQRHLGYFVTQKEAAEKYNKAAIELFGEYAHLNEV